MTDSQIIDEIRKGNKNIAKCFCNDKYFRPVERYVTSNSGILQDAEDLFQEAAMIFYENARKPEFVLEAKISTYIYKVGVYRWLGKLRERKRRNEQLSDPVDLPELIKDFKFDVFEPKPDLWEVAKEAIKGLSEKCQDILYMAFYHNMSNDSIKEEVGSENANTVGSQKYRCMKELKELCEEMLNKP